MKRWHLTAGLSAAAALAATLVPYTSPWSLAPLETPPPPLPVVDVAGPEPISIEAHLDQTAIPAGQTTERYLVIEVAAPEMDGDVRRPVHLAVVMDTSGSMAGRDKITSARKAAQELVASLQPQDSFALVGFSDAPRSYIQAASADAGSTGWSRIIDGLQPGGGTNIYAGLESGFAELDKMTGEGVERVVLLSDGMANIGVTDPNAIRDLAGKHTGDGTTVSALGMGLDFNEDLLGAISDAGGGRYAFVDGHGDLGELFQGELDAMTRVAAQQVSVNILLVEGVELIEVLGSQDRLTGRTDHGFSVFLGDVHGGERKKVVVRIRIEAGVRDGIRPIAQAQLRGNEQLPNFSHEALYQNSTVSVEVTESIQKVEASVDTKVVEPVLRAISGAQLDRAARAYADGKGESARQVLDEGRVELEALGRRYQSPAAGQLISELDDNRSIFESAPMGSEGQLFQVKKAKEAARDLTE